MIIFKILNFPEFLITVIDPFHGSVPFLYLLKTSENLRFSDLFRRLQKWTIGVELVKFAKVLSTKFPSSMRLRGSQIILFSFSFVKLYDKFLQKEVCWSVYFTGVLIFLKVLVVVRHFTKMQTLLQALY